MVHPTEGGCWFCHEADGVLAFDAEFDSYVHLDCIRKALRNATESGRKNEKAEIMSYLLHEDN